MSQRRERKGRRLLIVAALLGLLGLFVAFDGMVKTNYAIRALIDRGGKQRAIADIKQRYPTAMIVNVWLVNIAWGEVGEWSIAFAVDQTCYHAWYTHTGETQTELFAYPQFEGSLCQKEQLY